MERIVTPTEADYVTVTGMVGALCGTYPFLTAAPIGHSIEQRKLWGLTLGCGKERVLMAAAFHGQEWLTTLVCLQLCEDICRALSLHRELCGWDLHRALQGRSLVFVPLVNPDGVQRALQERDGHWQANARGVDLNHNFNAGWEELQRLERKNGIVGPGPRQWGGPHPESEPETAALTALCRRAGFRHAVALHSQGEEIYWQYGEHTPPSSKLMAMVMASVSGYTVSAPTGLASHGGFKDWFIEQWHRPAFTVELGKGINPLPLTEYPSVYEKAREMLLISLLM